MVSPLLLPRSTLLRSSLLRHHHPSPPSLTQSRHLHVRSVSIFTGLGRLAGRTAGRGALGLGVGAGALTWAEYKVDGFKQNAVSTLSSINSRLGEAYDSASSSLSDTFSSLTSSGSETISSVSETASTLWADTAVGVEERLRLFRERWKQAFESEEGEEGAEQESSGGRRGGKKKPDPEEGPGPLPLATATALSSSLPVVLDASPEPSTDSTEDLMLLTRKLIEIRSILLSIGEEAGLTLPSIVVIGSQSSGKSSVLEAIVGREFLPKGDNMVTRRPIELTLIHTPPSPSTPHPQTYAEFPSLGPGHITDFSIVQQTLLDLNLSVPASDCVSDTPIHLRIHSPHVPDLSLVDLPGYVQISSLDQPEELKEKIAGLCDKYIRAPNLILAVCAADVDLANSPALRAAKKVDPLGMRTIGVVTKMDLVEREAGAAVLRGNRYPLALGYVGVVCKAKPVRASGGLLGGGGKEMEEGTLVGPIRKQEETFFLSEEGKRAFSHEGIMVGTDTLKNRLMHVLEESMAASLHSISNTIQLELEEATYQFKVQYNDRAISPEGYVAETLDQLKARIGVLGKGFEKKEVRRLLKTMMDEQVLDLLAAQYWVDPRTPELGTLANDRSVSPEELDVYWVRKLDALASSLTKSGVGRASTQLVVDAIRARLTTLSQEEPLLYHPDAADRIASTADSILRERFTLTSDQVENSVKPFKYEVEVDQAEWEVGRQRSVELVKRELGMCEGALGRIRDAVGGRKLRGAMEFVAEGEEKERRRRERRREARLSGNAEEDEEDPDGADPNRVVYNPALLAKAREAMFLSTRSSVLRLRLLALKSRRCKAGPEQKAFCPEAFLNVVADKLSGTAVQFINIELLVEFFYQFPRDLDTRLSYSLDRSEIVRFAKENPQIARHLALQDRKDKLELVADKLDSLVKLQRDKAAQQDPRGGAGSSATGGRGRLGKAAAREEGKRGLFGMF
ncbi:hypothetical protein JCM11641_003558 [Rhodosporidiobolus odoratus]